MSAAERLNELGRGRLADGELDGAATAFRGAIEAAPDWSVPWFNLGLCHKRAARWADCATCNAQAVELNPHDQGAWWNLGIAATAKGDWNEARRAWRGCGIDVPDGEGAPAMVLGLTPIRIDPEGRGEVVWCDRIDPARAVVRNVPLPESGHRFGDVLLHDGEPRGSRKLGEREVAVFDALALLVRSDLRTWILDVPDSSSAAREALEDLAHEMGVAAEDWSRSVAFICRSCSLGRAHDRHDTELRRDRPTMAMALAARSEEEVREVLERWRQRSGYDGLAGYVAAEDSWGPAR